MSTSAPSHPVSLKIPAIGITSANIPASHQFTSLMDLVIKLNPLVTRFAMAMTYAYRGNASSHITNVLTLVGFVAVMIFILSILLSTPYLTDSGPLSSKSHTIMIIGITILATIFSLIVTSRMRHLFLQNVNATLTNMARRPEDAIIDTEELKRLDRRWRCILSIDSASEKLQNYAVVLAYAFCALPI